MAKETKTKNTAIRLTNSDYERFCKLAEKQHLTISNWIRIALFEKEERDAKRK